ncbi:FAD binding domain-containing protein [Sedimentitalea todarodis]|uniref:FAD binding domain-containing protein n=1 Tax=Sedimentitalea todarodis TaxID=1631240 RepID=A0ABU3V874_9RHOB|nr:FAD binding domain-containing protein [Sedimentitalea todarodis]MDU9002363.1 FAD binding domain-containing protein [Sedimentitalea todarodis]
MPSYYRPATLTDALAVLADTGAVVAAGCTDLFPATDRQELAGPVLDITGISGLRGVSRTQEGWRLGATTTWSDLLDAELPPAFDMLKQAAAEVGSVQIQNAGTVAGNLCNASPAADGVPPLLALDAEVELTGPEGTRRLPLAGFLTGVRQTRRHADELLTAVHVPDLACRGASRFRKLGARKYLVISIAMVAVRQHVVNGVVADMALAVGSCSAVAVRLRDLERALIGQPIEGLSDHLTDAGVASCLSPISDIRADAPYRAGAATELLRRALTDLADTS